MWLRTRLTMTLAHHVLLEPGVREAHLFCQAQGLVGEVEAMGDPVEWEEVWPTWVALEDQVVDSRGEDPLLHLLHPAQDRITQSDMEECLRLEEEEVVVPEVAFLQEAHRSLTCHLILAHLCTQGKGLTLYCHLAEWVVVLEVAVLLTHALRCSSLSMDRVVILSTVLQCLAALGVLLMAR